MFVLPAKSEVGYLDPSISGEGQKIIYSDGDTTNWSPPPPQPVMPDWSGIKSLRRYFAPRPFAPFPAWLYHKDDAQEPRLVKDAHQAAELGVCYRDATVDERGKYGLSQVWDWKDDSPWRPKPAKVLALDPKRPGQGKNVMLGSPDPMTERNALLNQVIPAVTAAVVAALKAEGPAKPGAVDPAQWNAFLEFQAWQKTQEAVQAIENESEVQPPVVIPPTAGTLNVGDTITDEHGRGGSVLSVGGSGSLLSQLAEVMDAEPDAADAQAAASDERAHWLAEAERKGVKVDKRWGLDRLKAEVTRAA